MSIPIYPVSPRVQFIAAAAQTVFNIPFAFFVDGDISAWSEPAGTPSQAGNDVTYILVIAADYTLTGAGSATGGTLTLITPASAGDIITIVRTMPEQRLSLYLAGGLFTADQVNNDMSMEVMMSQQNQLQSQVLTPHYQFTDEVTSSDLLMQILPAGYSWRMNSTGTYIEAFLAASTSPPVSPTNSTTMQVTITQTAHGLIAGDVVRCSGTNTFVKAQANTAANAEAIGIVASVTDANNFVLQYGGLVTTGLAGLTPGDVYYLSPFTAGFLTSTRPSVATQVVKPLLISIGAASGIWNNLLGIVL